MWKAEQRNNKKQPPLVAGGGGRGSAEWEGGPASSSAISACDFHFISLRDSWQLEQIKGISHPARNSLELLLSPTSQDRQQRQQIDQKGRSREDESNWDWDWDAVSDASRHASMIRKCKQTEFVEGTQAASGRPGGGRGNNTMHIVSTRERGRETGKAYAKRSNQSHFPLPPPCDLLCVCHLRNQL